jgi:hypothetical protein
MWWVFTIWIAGIIVVGALIRYFIGKINTKDGYDTGPDRWKIIPPR